MKSFLIFVVIVGLLGAGLAMARSGEGLGVMLIVLALMLGWYGERARNWGVVLKLTKKSVKDYRKATWRSRGYVAIVATVTILVLYSQLVSKED